MNTKATVWAAVVVTVMFALGFFLVGRLSVPQGPSRAAVDSLLAATRALSVTTEARLRAAEVALRRGDSLAHVAGVARAHAAATKRVADSLRVSLAAAATARDSLPVVVAALDSADEAYAELDAAYEVQEGLALVYRDAADSLRQIVDVERTARVAATTALTLRPTVPAPGCRVLGVPCPVLVLGPALSQHGVSGLAIAVGFPLSRLR